VSRRQLVVLIDDLDGSESDVQPVSFSIDGQAYEIDLSAENRQQLDALLQPYIAAGRRAKRQRRRAAP
jgi:hypothetical protein